MCVVPKPRPPLTLLCLLVLVACGVIVDVVQLRVSPMLSPTSAFGGDVAQGREGTQNVRGGGAAGVVGASIDHTREARARGFEGRESGGGARAHTIRARGMSVGGENNFLDATCEQHCTGPAGRLLWLDSCQCRPPTVRFYAVNTVRSEN